MWPWIVAGVVLAAAILLLKLLASPARAFPYRKRSRLVTKAELRFFRALQLAVQDDYLIFAMVRVADILVVPEGTPQRRSWFNRIAGKHIDFVLCDPGTLEPRLAIELDDASHQRPDRIARDRFINDAFGAAKLPLMRVPAAATFEAQNVREQIVQSIKDAH